VVKRFEWTNPHAYIYIAVKDEKGQATEWAIELMSLNHLKGYGWSRNTVKPGDTITCTGGAAKSGDPQMLSSLIKLNNGDLIKSQPRLPGHRNITARPAIQPIGDDSLWATHKHPSSFPPRVTTNLCSKDSGCGRS